MSVYLHVWIFVKNTHIFRILITGMHNFGILLKLGKVWDSLASLSGSKSSTQTSTKELTEAILIIILIFCFSPYVLKSIEIFLLID